MGQTEAHANTIAEREGWTTDTLLGVVLDYIDNQQDDDGFLDYLESRSYHEGE